MPREAAVKHEAILAEAKKFPASLFFYKGDKVSPPKAQIWKDLAAVFHNKLNPKNLYTIFYLNRQDLRHKLQTHFNIPIREEFTLEQEDRLSVRKAEMEMGEASCPGEVDNFVIIIPPDVWEKMKPEDRVRKRKDTISQIRTDSVLQRGWGDQVVAMCWKQLNFPCPYTFHKSAVSKGKKADYYVRMEGCCRECGATCLGTIKDKPVDGAEVILRWKANNTKGLKHSSKRPLRGEERAPIGKEVRYQSAYAFRRFLANENMNFNDAEPPMLYSAAVLQKAGQDYRNKELGDINKEDVFKSLVYMKHTEPYAGWIQFISMDPVMVRYSMASQYEIYKDYVRKKKIFAKICIDATGSLIRKVNRGTNLSSHLFLYEIVINTGKNQLPINQMISERQDTNAILFWILDWRRNGARIPQETVCDGSRALLNACVRGLGECRDMEDYKKKCFNAALSNSETMELPCTFIRMDVAHVIKTVCRWKEWGKMKRMKEFFLRSFVVLLESTNLNSFRTVLKMILVLLFANSNGNANNRPTPAEKCLKRLAEEIGKIRDVNELITEEVLFAKESEETNLSEHHEEEDESDNSPPELLDWLETVKKEAWEDAKIQGDRISPYYSEKIGKRFIDLCSDFLLWSAVMAEKFKSPSLRGSSASVESDFANLKKRIMKNEEKPLLLHKFVARHLTFIAGETKITLGQKETTEQEIINGKNNPDEEQTDRLSISFEENLFNNNENSCDLQDNRGLQTATEDDNRVQEDFLCDESLHSILKSLEESHVDLSDVQLETPIYINEQKEAGKRKRKIKLHNSCCFSAKKKKPNEESPADLNEVENWRNLGGKENKKLKQPKPPKPPRKDREFKYVTPCRDILAAQNLETGEATIEKTTTERKRKGYVIDERGLGIEVLNTCPFDTVC